jgi:hypothetical protein
VYVSGEELKGGNIWVSQCGRECASLCADDVYVVSSNEHRCIHAVPTLSSSCASTSTHLPAWPHVHLPIRPHPHTQTHLCLHPVCADGLPPCTRLCHPLGQLSLLLLRGRLPCVGWSEGVGVGAAWAGGGEGEGAWEGTAWHMH